MNKSFIRSTDRLNKITAEDIYRLALRVSSHKTAAKLIEAIAIAEDELEFPILKEQNENKNS